MCDAALDGDMYDHSTESGDWLVDGKTVDPVRSDPRCPRVIEECKGDEEEAFKRLTAGDPDDVVSYAREKFDAFRAEYPLKKKPKPKSKKKVVERPKSFADLKRWLKETYQAIAT